MRINEDDWIGVTVDKNSNTNYIPPEIVTRQNIQNIVDQYNHSQKAAADAWRIFTALSKVQPFQDGNK
ncbi:Fic family protein [Loigolactobacillus zhaoyuanensis]|uniref:Fic family protein n=1 Tax=Loigolactobacillus zhaoyuanensis TaxID=2486017 RepID=UPI000F737D90|nr:Fic family protein [Loigolactobacillus zhaoyuanensis]